MALRKDDPVYYKVKLAELLLQAKDNGISVIIDKPKIIFCNNIGEKSGVRIEGY